MSWKPGTVQLATGERVPSDSPLWLQECRVRHAHVQTLLRMRGAHMRAARQQYLVDVAAKEGVEAAERVKQALLDAWCAPQALPKGGDGQPG